VAHFITRPPDFDHILSVKIIDHKFTDEELSRGICIDFPERKNIIPMKIKEGEQIFGEVKISDTADSLKLSWKPAPNSISVLMSSEGQRQCQWR
jgi:hypothetical protein